MGHHILGYLIGLGIGYFVLTHADKQKGLTKKVGTAIAWLIIVVSLIGPLCAGYYRMKCHSGSPECSYMSHDQEKGGSMEDKDKGK